MIALSENSCGMKGEVMYITLESEVEAKNTLFKQNMAFIDHPTCTNITRDGGVSSAQAFCEDHMTINCSKKPTDIQVMQGKQFSIPVAAVNQVNTSVRGDVRAYFSRTNTSGQLAEGQSQQSTDENVLTYNTPCF